MALFGTFYLDKEKDIIIELRLTEQGMTYVLRTPNHAKGNLITNLAHLCGLPLSTGEDGLKIITGEVPCYIDERNRAVYVLRLADTKVANIYPDGAIERKAYIPAISKTLMSQTKDYRLDAKKTLVKTYIRRECKFCTDLHTHMNANLDADVLIALGIFHQIRYPLYYIKKLRLRCTEEQTRMLEQQRASVARKFADSPLTGKYRTRKIDDNTFINFADLILGNLGNAPYNLPRIRVRRSLPISKRSICIAMCSPKDSRPTRGFRWIILAPFPTGTLRTRSGRCAATAVIRISKTGRSFKTSSSGLRAACKSAAWCMPKSPTQPLSSRSARQKCWTRCTAPCP